jgi:hypothetical protein
VLHAFLAEPSLPQTAAKINPQIILEHLMKMNEHEAEISNVGRQLLRLLLEKIPLIALSVVSSTVTFLAQRGALGWTEQLPMLARINNAIVTIHVLTTDRSLYCWHPGCCQFD